MTGNAAGSTGMRLTIRAAQKATRTIPILGIARGRTRKLAGAARRQYNGRQHPRDRA